VGHGLAEELLTAEADVDPLLQVLEARLLRSVQRLDG
jgi:hypothetical protein